MEIPKEITDKHLQAALCAGRIIRRITIFPDGEQSLKRLVILTNDNEKAILSVTTTTNITPSKFYNRDDILIKANQEKFFECDTYIQLSRVFELPVKILKKEYNKKQLDNLGKISDSLLNDIYTVVEQSELIEQKFIDRIIKERR